MNSIGRRLYDVGQSEIKMTYVEDRELASRAFCGDRSAMTELREARRVGGSLIPKELNNYDWDEAFKYAAGPTAAGVVAGKKTRPGFTREDVAFVLHYANGQNDEDDWVGVFLLYDGRYACLRAGCDYTGWG